MTKLENYIYKQMLDFGMLMPLQHGTILDK